MLPVTCLAKTQTTSENNNGSPEGHFDASGTRFINTRMMIFCQADAPEEHNSQKEIRLRRSNDLFATPPPPPVLG